MKEISTIELQTLRKGGKDFILYVRWRWCIKRYSEQTPPIILLLDIIKEVFDTDVKGDMCFERIYPSYKRNLSRRRRKCS